MQDNPWGSYLQAQYPNIYGPNAGSASVAGPVAGGASPAASSAGVAGNSGATTGMAIGAGLGLLSAIGQQNAYQHQAKAAATQTRFSPWTKMGLGSMPTPPNALGQILGYGAAGGAMGQAAGGGSLVPMAMMAGG